jgi:hypothetical protein
MDAHSNEYAAAVAAMSETYGRCLPDVGDTVRGVTRGREWIGEVMTAEPGRLAIDCSDAWIATRPADVIEVIRKAGA